MLNTVTSASMNQLADIAADTLLRVQQRDPLRAPWIVVQNRETREWLQLQFAARKGISANLNFLLPSELVFRLYRKVKPDTPTVLPADRMPLHWRIHELLSDTQVRTELRKLGLPDTADSIQQFQLAGQLADVFDLYQMYRPDMLTGWSKNKMSTGQSYEIWQAALWRTLAERSPAVIHDRAGIWQELLSHLSSAEANGSGLPADLLIFGLSHFSKPFARLLSALGDHAEVSCFLTDIPGPTPEDNAWSALHTQWMSLKSAGPDLLNEQGVPIQKEEQVVSNLYQKLQHREGVDQVLEIHSCHSSRREVEVLKDTILREMNRNPELKSEDILIMVPDMQEYGPLIHSIFRFGQSEPVLPVGYPFTGVKEHQRLLTALLRLFTNTIKASDMIGLLELKPVKDRFAFSDDDIAVLSSWISKQFIHHGLDRKESAYSFEKLSHALMASYVMEGDVPDVYSGLALGDHLNGADQLSLLSRFSSLIHTLLEWRPGNSDQLLPEEWIGQMQKWIGYFSGPDDAEAAFLERLKDGAAASGSTQKTDIRHMKLWIQNYLTDQEASSTGLGSGVVVSSYIPYRSIPFRMIAILGLNERTFPRNPARPDFDLIHNRPEAGERITRKDDELLFLETLNAAEERLFISYLGQDLHKNEELLPSVLLLRLLDVLNIPEEKLLTKEKLHGSDPSYFRNADSFSGYRKVLSERISQKNKEIPPFWTDPEDKQEWPAIESGELRLSEVIRFFGNPSEYLCRNLLKIDQGREEEDPSDRELFKASGLDSYKLNEFILSHYEADPEGQRMLSYLQARGMVPQGVGGEKEFISEAERVHLLLDEVQSHLNGESRTEELSVELEDLQVMHRFQQVSGNKQVIWKNAKMKARYQIEAWISHLFALCGQTEIDETVLVAFNHNKTKATVVQFGDVEDPAGNLKGLISWFKKASSDRDLLCFFPESSKAFAMNGSLEDAYGKWEGDRSAESDDHYYKRIWRECKPLELDAFPKNSVLFWDPVYKAAGGKL